MSTKPIRPTAANCIDLSAAVLHIIAMALMLMDHLWATLLPAQDWLTCAGRLAFPIFAFMTVETSVYKGYKRDKIEMRGDRAEMSDFPLYLNTVAGGLDRRDQTIGGFSFVVKIYAVPVVEIIG